MGAKVYANAMEVSGKATPHKVIASMPDVCLSPPSPPAGPIPIPYPNFAQGSDTTNGSKTVKAGGKEISLKGKSKYKKSTGDEAATRSFGAGIISHSITGSVKHKAGSFDVKVEGSSVVRNLDLTTGNHSNPGDGCASVDAAGVIPGFAEDPDCEDLRNGNDKRREDIGHESTKSTVGHAKIERPKQQTVTVWSCSESLAKANKNGTVSFVSGGYVAGLERIKGVDVYDMEGRMGKEGASNLCVEARDSLKQTRGGDVQKSTKNQPKCSHVESRVLESLFDGPTPPPPGTTVTFAIAVNKENKKTGDFYTDDNPCPTCRVLVCAAELCNIEIKFCDAFYEAKDVRDKTDHKCPQDN